MSDATVWDQLAERFPDTEVKERQGPKKHAGNCEKEYGSCRLEHKMLAYVDARAVHERLDAALTPLGWEFTCAPIPGTEVVHGRLAVRVDGVSIVREDFGYPNSADDEEPLKAAASDAIKRCAVQLGVGRHLYIDNQPRRRSSGRSASPGGGGTSSAPAARTPSPATAERVAAVTDGGDRWFGRVGVSDKPNSPYSGRLREGKKGPFFGFEMYSLDVPAEGRNRTKVEVFGPLAIGVAGGFEGGMPASLTVWGTARTEVYGEHPYTVIEATRLVADDWQIPAEDRVPARVAAAATATDDEDLSQLPF